MNNVYESWAIVVIWTAIVALMFYLIGLWKGKQLGLLEGNRRAQELSIAYLKENSRAAFWRDHAMKRTPIYELEEDRPPCLNAADRAIITLALSLGRGAARAALATPEENEALARHLSVEELRAIKARAEKGLSGTSYKGYLMKPDSEKS